MVKDGISVKGSKNNKNINYISPNIKLSIILVIDVFINYIFKKLVMIHVTLSSEYKLRG